MNSPKMTRTRFALSKKVEMLDLFRGGKSRNEICQSYGILPSTFQNFLREETRLRAEFEKNRNSKCLTIRNSPQNKLEQALIKWICIVREQKIALSGPMVQEKALEFATLLSVKDFTASNSLLDHFKMRENLDFKNVVGKGGDIDVNVVQNWTKNFLPSQRLRGR